MKDSGILSDMIKSQVLLAYQVSANSEVVMSKLLLKLMIWNDPKATHPKAREVRITASKVGTKL